MDKEKLLERIEINPNKMVGKPFIKGTRLTVQYILGLMARGETVDNILKEYNGLIKEDILACLVFATEALESTSFVPLEKKAV
jgi:uncharacterized protein (DUF433 family)